MQEQAEAGQIEKQQRELWFQRAGGTIFLSDNQNENAI